LRRRGLFPSHGAEIGATNAVTAIFDREDTLAAAVSAPARGSAGNAVHNACLVEVTTALTDGASHVIAPGSKA
jgi:hypothetical protein